MNSFHKNQLHHPNLCLKQKCIKAKGSSINHVDTKGGRGGQPNVYVCLRGGKGWLDECLRRHNFPFFPSPYSGPGDFYIKNSEPIWLNLENIRK